MELQSFSIKGLHGVLNYKLLFKNNNLILIGENGSCKSTIMKILFYTLSSQWMKLVQYNFESILIKMDEQEFLINKKDIQNFKIKDRAFFSNLPPRIRHEFLYVHDRRMIDLNRIKRLCEMYDIPFEYIMNELDHNEDNESKNTNTRTFKDLKKAINNTNILYLPTYRRIEQDLNTIFEGRLNENNYHDKDGIIQDCNFNELIEFGMHDVKEIINGVLKKLKDSFTDSLNQLTLEYLGEIVDGQYQDVDINSIKNVDDDTIQRIMNRVENNILSDGSKKKLSVTLQKIKDKGANDDHDKVVCHYFIKLLNSHRELEKNESDIRAFAEVCRKYISNKRIVYDSPTFDFYIKSNITDEKIDLNQLSSGEKQIVSLFCHLYLDGKRNCLILIDEPELSLSVKWQQTFLPDLNNGQNCIGTIAVTHSPFIFDNELDLYAHGLNEFITK